MIRKIIAWLFNIENRIEMPISPDDAKLLEHDIQKYIKKTNKKLNQWNPGEMEKDIPVPLSISTDFSSYYQKKGWEVQRPRPSVFTDYSKRGMINLVFRRPYKSK